MAKSLKCFISYSWDSEYHKGWVRFLAEQLVQNGIDIKLDQWDIFLGDPIPQYMATSVSESDYVLLICTPNFASKANLGQGGVGYETNIVNGQIFSDVVSDRKFIPILREDDPKLALPSYLKSRAYIDFRDDSNFEANLENLLRHIYEEPEFKKPTLGQKPVFDYKFGISQSDLSDKNYRTQATSFTPALIIYLIDVSGSTSETFENTNRIEAVTNALSKAAVWMVQRSIKGAIIAPRYRVGMFAYSDDVIDLLGGIKTIDELAKMGIPRLTTLSTTNTAKAFALVENVLKQEIPNIQNCPAPLICHLSDGEYIGKDPLPIMQRIMNLSTKDGNVLIENIYMKNDISFIPVQAVNNWKGFQNSYQFKDQYAKSLFEGSSLIPQSYREVLNEFGCKFQPNSRLFFPGSTTKLLELAFATSGMETLQLEN